jgi:hypothetical protein
MSAEQLDLEATMVLAGHWSCEYHLDDHLSAVYECGIVVEASHSPSLTVRQQKHLAAAVLAAGWVSPAAVAERDAELERLRGAASDIERLSDTYTVEGTEIVMQRIIDLRADLDHDRAVLGAVAALADRARNDLSRGYFLTGRIDVSELDTVLGPVSGAVEARVDANSCPGCGIHVKGIRPPAPHLPCSNDWHLGVSGAVEGARDMEAAVQAGARAVAARHWPDLDWFLVNRDTHARLQADVEVAIAAALPHLSPPPSPVAGHEQKVRAEAVEWRVVHPHPSNLEPGGETWTERESEEQALNYQRSGFTIQRRTVGEWVDVPARASGSSAPVQGGAE